MTPLIQIRETVIVPAGQSKVISPASDYVHFQTVPAGLLIGVNGGIAYAFQQGTILQGTPGERGVQTLLLNNTTGAELTALIVHGTGEMSVAGEVTLTGSIPLATGASTSALQTTGNASLATLAAANTDTGKIVNLGASSGASYAGCKSFSIINTGTGDVVLTIAGIAGNLPAGYGVDIPLSKALNTLATITVATGVGGAALIALTT